MRSLDLGSRGRWILIGMSAAAVAACDAVLGIRDYGATAVELGDGGAGAPGDAGADGGTGETATACGLNAGSSTCAECLQAQCCSQATACAASSGCAEYENCLLPCGGDYACRSRCLISAYANVVTVPALDQCVASQCSDSCGLTCNSTNMYTEPDAATACERCITANACSGAAQCSTSGECQKILQCGISCTSPDCLWGCSEAEEAGIAPFTSYAAGMESCASACDLGEFWDCALGASAGISEAGQTTLTLNFIVVPNGAPVVGATVKACSLDDIDCASPYVAPGTTDAQGDVTLVLPATGSIGFNGYFDVSSPSIYPTLYFLQTALTAPKARLPELLLPSPSFIPGWYSSYGVTPDASRSVIEIQATDCHWYPASRVTARADANDGGLGFAYFINAVLTPSATSTDLAGYAVLLNAPARTQLTISVRPLAAGRETSSVRIFARAGAWSFMDVHPL